MLLFSRGQHETGWGLLADPCRPLPGLARCRRGRLPTAAAERRLLLRRCPLGSLRSLKPARPAPPVQPGRWEERAFPWLGAGKTLKSAFISPNSQVLSYRKMQLCTAPGCWAGSQERGTLILDREEVSACPVLTLPAPVGTGQGR